MLKIIHCADIHLDSPFGNVGAHISHIRKEELRSSFLSLIDYAKRSGADIVLLAGDLFDGNFVSWQTAELVTAAFASAPECRFVISPGNHDPYTPGSVYAKCRFPENVYIFSEPSLSRFSFPELDTDIYGYAFTSGTMSGNPFCGRTPERMSGINLLCAHGDVGVPLSHYCPVSESDIRDSGFDYCAFGHVHNGGEVSRAGNTYYAYSGCLVGRDFGETGEKGALELEIEKTNGILTLRHKFVPFSERVYEISDVDVSGCRDGHAVMQTARNAVTESGYGKNTLLRLGLTGSVPPSLDIDVGAVESALADMLYYVEAEDRTLPIYDAKQLESDMTIRGAFFRELLPALEHGTAEERTAAAQALRVGLAALAGEDFTSVI